MARTERASQPQVTRSKTPKAGHLPISELAYDRPGAASPFGDDQSFPLPVERLTYTRGPDAGH